ncbi:MAG: acylphosphatase [Pseudomonadota bacterium]
MTLRTVHIRITGRVQGVYYRAWTEREAVRLGLDGWVRNRRDRSVEAVFSGVPDAVARMLSLCIDGPPDARVTDVRIISEGGGVPAGFAVLPTE